MKLYGLQKMTLLDFPGKVACTVFLGGCDFRCPFCHNFELAELKAEPLMESGEFLEFLKKRKGLLDGVAVTGGEPCLWKELPDFLREIRALGFHTKLDTNGNHPELLRKILSEGLADYVAMDIKSSPGRYALVSGLPSMNLVPVRESIRLLLEGNTEYEFRTTVVKELHREEDFPEMGEMIRGAKRYFLQSFTDRDTVPYEGFSAPSKEEMRRYADLVRPYVQEVGLRGVE